MPDEVRTQAIPPAGRPEYRLARRSEAPMSPAPTHLAGTVEALRPFVPSGVLRHVAGRPAKEPA
jgi:hypothetical protein